MSEKDKSSRGNASQFFVAGEFSQRWQDDAKSISSQITNILDKGR